MIHWHGMDYTRGWGQVKHKFSVSKQSSTYIVWLRTSSIMYILVEQSWELPYLYQFSKNQDHRTVHSFISCAMLILLSRMFLGPERI
jgi:hypothetical protein